MKLLIDSAACEQAGMTIEEFMVLYLNSKNANIKDLMASLIEKGIANKNLFDSDTLILSANAKQLVGQVLVNSDKVVQDNSKRLEELADKLRALYPDGRKPGTTYYWKDSTAVIAKKLKALVKKYGDCFTDEQAINATKRYVDSFNGDYRFMQLLKYFISKNVVKGGEVEEQSQFLSYIENAAQEDKNQLEIDWETELR